MGFMPLRMGAADMYHTFNKSAVTCTTLSEEPAEILSNWAWSDLACFSSKGLLIGFLAHKLKPPARAVMPSSTRDFLWGRNPMSCQRLNQVVGVQQHLNCRMEHASLVSPNNTCASTAEKGNVEENHS